MMEEKVRTPLDEIIREDFATQSKDLKAARKLRERIRRTDYENGSDGGYDLDARCKDELEYESARLRYLVSHYRGSEPKKAAEIEQALRELEKNVLPLAEFMGYTAVFVVYRAGLMNGGTTPRDSDIRQEAPRHRQIAARKVVKHAIRSIAEELWSNPSIDDEWNSKLDKRIGSMAHHARSMVTAWIEEDALDRASPPEYVDLYRRAIPKNIEDVKAILKEHPSVVPEWALRGGRPKSK